jgi:hypothetical protein
MEFNKDTFVKVNGLFDIEASLTNVAAALAAANELYANDAEVVGAAVAKVFDTYKGAFVNLDAVTTIAIGSMGLTSLEAINAMSERVNEFVLANSEGESSLYEIRRGRGVGRRADVPAKGAKPESK